MSLFPMFANWKVTDPAEQFAYILGQYSLDTIEEFAEEVLKCKENVTQLTRQWGRGYGVDSEDIELAQQEYDIIASEYEYATYLYNTQLNTYAKAAGFSRG